MAAATATPNVTTIREMVGYFQERVAAALGRRDEARNHLAELTGWADGTIAELVETDLDELIGALQLLKNRQTELDGEENTLDAAQRTAEKLQADA